MLQRLDVRGIKKLVSSGHLKMSGASPHGSKIDFTNYYMTLNDKPVFVISGEFHFSRYDRRFWKEEILKIKACGINVISTYVFWNHHEAVEGIFDFTRNFDLREFVRLCREHELMVIIRIGPYCHGECRNGGLPDWLFGRPFEVRSNDEEYLAYVDRYFRAISIQVADLMFPKGGNIIGIQLENEYMSSCSPWEITVTQNREWTTTGTDGLEHIEELKRLAEKSGLKTVFYAGTAWGNAPIIDNEMLPLWGGYAYWPWIYWDQDAGDHPVTEGYIFRDCHNEANPDKYTPKYPYACCELGGGMQVWYPYRFVVEPESVEAMSIMAVAGGCNFLGYYMFHGGFNPVVNNTFMNEQLCPRISYDFQAPLGDYGQVRESYKRLKLLHYMFNDLSDFLCSSKTVIPQGQETIKPADTKPLRYAARACDSAGILFINNYQDHVEQTDKTGIRFEVETDKGTIVIPIYNELTVPKNTACALLFGIELSGLSLDYTTAQYITRIEDTYFFFSHKGMPGEFCFNETYDVLNKNNAKYETRDNKLFVYLPAKGYSGFILKDKHGKTVKFICMDREKSLEFHKINVMGRDYAILSKSNVYCNGSDIFLETLGNEESSLLAYPRLRFARIENGDVRYNGTQGYMHQYAVSADMPEVNLNIKKKYANRALVDFDAAVLDKLTELYLKIDYKGDIGWAFINGRLIHDNFNNGTAWEIGLKSFAQELSKNNLYIYISPLAKGESEVKYENTHARIETSEDVIAEISSITAIPEQTITIKGIYQ